MIDRWRRAFFGRVLLPRFFRQDSLNLAFFSLCFGARLCLASVSVDDVRDVINVSSAGVPDAKVLKMVKRAKGAPAVEFCSPQFGS